MQKLLHQIGGTLMKRFVMVVVLAGALSGVAVAGEMPISGAPQPQPSPTQTSVAASVVLTLISLLGR